MLLLAGHATAGWQYWGNANRRFEMAAQAQTAAYERCYAVGVNPVTNYPWTARVALAFERGKLVNVKGMLAGASAYYLRPTNNEAYLAAYTAAYSLASMRWTNLQELATAAGAPTNWFDSTPWIALNVHSNGWPYVPSVCSQLWVSDHSMYWTNGTLTNFVADTVIEEEIDESWTGTNTYSDPFPDDCDDMIADYGGPFGHTTWRWPPLWAAQDYVWIPSGGTNGNVTLPEARYDVVVDASALFTASVEIRDEGSGNYVLKKQDAVTLRTLDEQGWENTALPSVTLWTGAFHSATFILSTNDVSEVYEDRRPRLWDETASTKDAVTSGDRVYPSYADWYGFFSIQIPAIYGTVTTNCTSGGYVELGNYWTVDSTNEYHAAWMGGPVWKERAIVRWTFDY
jgi:hypothetical protein